MALTTEELQQIEFTRELELARIAARETERSIDSRRDMVRLAKEALLQNKLDQPSGSREVTANDIISYATALEAYLNS